MGSVAYEGTTYRQNPSTPTLRPTNGRPNVIGVDGFRRYFHDVCPTNARRGPAATSKVDLRANPGQLVLNASKAFIADLTPQLRKIDVLQIRGSLQRHTRTNKLKARRL